MSFNSHMSRIFRKPGLTCSVSTMSTEPLSPKRKYNLMPHIDFSNGPSIHWNTRIGKHLSKVVEGTMLLWTLAAPRSSQPRPGTSGTIPKARFHQRIVEGLTAFPTLVCNVGCSKQFCRALKRIRHRALREFLAGKKTKTQPRQLTLVV